MGVRYGNVVSVLRFDLRSGVTRPVVTIPDEQVAVSRLLNRLSSFVAGGELNTVETAYIELFRRNVTSHSPYCWWMSS